MARAKSCEVTDEFWLRVEPLIPQRRRPPSKAYQRKPGGGRKLKDARLVFEAIVYGLRTGCQWKALPAKRYGSASAIHSRFLQWEAAGFFSPYGKLPWPSTTPARALHGAGKALTGR